MLLTSGETDITRLVRSVGLQAFRYRSFSNRLIQPVLEAPTAVALVAERLAVRIVAAQVATAEPATSAAKAVLLASSPAVAKLAEAQASPARKSVWELPAPPQPGGVPLLAVAAPDFVLLRQAFSTAAPTPQCPAPRPLPPSFALLPAQDTAAVAGA